jgi:polyphosphate kinase
MIEKIERELANQKAGKPARLLVKVNGILEPAVVKALYRASQAGVKIDIACRGICSLRPGIPGVSENVRVISVVDRFLEHSRIFYFENGGNPEVYVGSADWMDRNLSRRVEVVFPVEQSDLKQRVIEMLKITLGDNMKARELLPDGKYRRVKPPDGVAPLRSQQRFLELAADNGARPVAAATDPTPVPATRVVKRTQRDKPRRA